MVSGSDALFLVLVLLGISSSFSLMVLQDILDEGISLLERHEMGTMRTFSWWPGGMVGLTRYHEWTSSREDSGGSTTLFIAAQFSEKNSLPHFCFDTTRKRIEEDHQAGTVNLNSISFIKPRKHKCNPKTFGWASLTPREIFFVLLRQTTSIQHALYHQLWKRNRKWKRKWSRKITPESWTTIDNDSAEWMD